jgi:hypothetical protein
MKDFAERIDELASRAEKQIEFCTTEEATKNALVLPFIRALGYDVFNPMEVMPELTADFGTKRGEKVDYAIMQDGEPIILFECKKAGADLRISHASQLYRYFSVLKNVHFSVLTNGVTYEFYSDLDAPNRMDDRPFFTFDVMNYEERHVRELKRFTKSSFDLDEILETASELKYTAAITQIISDEFAEPSDEFVAFLGKQVYSGRMTQSARDQFRVIIQKALRRFLNEQVNERLQTALETYAETEEIEGEIAGVDVPTLAGEGDYETVVRRDPDRGTVTTVEEVEGFFAVKSILRDVIDLDRVTMRDTKSYCNVLLDDNNRKPICRLRFNRTQKHLGVFDEDRQEIRVAITEVSDIYEYADRIVATVKRYEADDMGDHAVAAGTRTRSSGRRQYTGKTIHAFVLGGKRHEVGTWREALLTILEVMRSSNPTKFLTVAVTMKGRKRPYISPDPSDLRDAHPIVGTDLYVETNLSSNMIARIAKQLVGKMGKDPDSLEFETT